MNEKQEYAMDGWMCFSYFFFRKYYYVCAASVLFQFSDFEKSLEMEWEKKENLFVD